MNFNVIFTVIFAIILLIVLITLIYNFIIGIRTNDYELAILCGVSSGLIGMFFSIALSSILFNI